MPSLHPTHDGGFLSQFLSLFGGSLDEFDSRQAPDRGAKPKLAAWELLASLVYHVLSGSGCFLAHVFQLFGMEIKDGSLLERRRMAEKLLARLPQGCLLIVDRLYGCGKYVKQLMESCEAGKSHLLVRARGDIKAHKAQRLSDGSALVSINQRDARNNVIGQIRVREIRGRIKKPGGGKWNEVKLWTTLLDEKCYPAEELLKLYGMRWEQEIFYKELKIHTRGGEVLKRHTPETAAQEVAALLIACAIIAEQRSEAARSANLQPLSIIFVKTLEKVTGLWAVLEVSGDLLEEETKIEMLKRVRALIVREAIPPRRSRSCPRKVRKPIGSWPRLTQNESHEGEFTFEVLNVP